MMRLVNNLAAPMQLVFENVVSNSPSFHSHLLMQQNVSTDVKAFLKYFCKTNGIVKNLFTQDLCNLFAIFFSNLYKSGFLKRERQ